MFLAFYLGVYALNFGYLRGVSEFPLDFLKDRVKVRVSCNGLLCCSSIPDKGVFYVCNPMTREFKLLPKTRERLVIIIAILALLKV